MRGDGGVPQVGDAALPSRQTWYPAQRWLGLALVAVVGGVMAVTTVLRLTTEPVDSGMGVVALLLLRAFPFVVLGVIAWSYSQSRLEADDAGLHVVTSPRNATTYPWADIIEIRPNIAKSRRTPLVLVRRHGPTVDLPVTEEHLEELRRWHAAAG